MVKIEPRFLPTQQVTVNTPGLLCVDDHGVYIVYSVSLLLAQEKYPCV